MYSFPKSFLWGCRDDAHCVEGGNFASDWWRWEQRPGRIAGETTSRMGAEHYGRYLEDFRLARRLGHKARLMNIEWARCEPEEGVFDEEAIGHYACVLQAASSLGLTPVCGLWNVTLPYWFAARGGWGAPGAGACFGRFVARGAPQWTEHCHWWIPLMEPVRWIKMALLKRAWPPASGNPFHARRAFRQMAYGYMAAREALRGARSDVATGVSLLVERVRPFDLDSPWDYRAAMRENYLANMLLPRAWLMNQWPVWAGGPLEQPVGVDFIAMAYYGARMVQFTPFRPGGLCVRSVDGQGREVAEDEWQPDPEGLYGALREVGALGKPILLSGNGLPTVDDRERCIYLIEHLHWLSKGMQEGVPVIGYFGSSFLDGFDWSHGYNRRWGLAYVDQETMMRTPNHSAYLLKAIYEAGGIREGMRERFVGR